MYGDGGIGQIAAKGSHMGQIAVFFGAGKPGLSNDIDQSQQSCGLKFDPKRAFLFAKGRRESTRSGRSSTFGFCDGSTCH